MRNVHGCVRVLQQQTHTRTHTLSALNPRQTTATPNDTTTNEHQKQKKGLQCDARYAELFARGRWRGALRAPKQIEYVSGVLLYVVVMGCVFRGGLSLARGPSKNTHTQQTHAQELRRKGVGAADIAVALDTTFGHDRRAVTQPLDDHDRGGGGGPDGVAKEWEEQEGEGEEQGGAAWRLLVEAARRRAAASAGEPPPSPGAARGSRAACMS